MIADIRKLNDIFERADEKKMFQGLMSNEINFDWVLSVYGITDAIALQEAKMASIDSKSKIAFIGGGSLPISAYLYAKATGCQVTVFDNDTKSIQDAGNFIELRKFSDKVKIEEADGRNIDFSKYSHAVTAVMVDDKDAVLTHIAETGKEGLIVICRSTEGIQQLIYSSVTKIPPELTLQHKISEATTTTYILKHT